MHRRERSSIREGTCPQRRRTPSFSSSLLDAIYRSIDESKTDLDEDQQPGLYNHNHNKQGVVYSEKGGIGKERMNLRQAVMIEDWMEKQNSSQSSQLLNSSSSSSESSSGCVFSSSETETTTTTHKKQSRTRPKQHCEKKHKHVNQDQQNKPQRECGFARTKLRALKIYYGELNQKVKQPISPGSRIASFLSSIFSSENVKKAKMCYVGAVEDVSFDHKSKSPCFSSSASTFSRRSCMTKTPSSAARSEKSKSNNNGVKRSVRFYPVSVILGEDSEQPSLLPLSSSVRKFTRNSSIKELKKNTVMAKENGGGVKGSYQNSGKGEFDFRGFYDDINGEEDEDDEDEDALSYSSSDLFELDHLVGAERYKEELPVYETTNLETNKAIANGLRL